MSRAVGRGRLPRGPSPLRAAVTSGTVNSMKSRRSGHDDAGAVLLFVFGDGRISMSARGDAARGRAGQCVAGLLSLRGKVMTCQRREGLG